jgi:S-adenosylmethionine hydrolase
MSFLRLGLVLPTLLLIVSTKLVYADTNGILVFQSDFGLGDQAVSAMHGVALGVDSKLVIEDLTHMIPAYNIWEGAYRLDAVVDFWPKHTVFVSVVDPGVGSERKSVVLKTMSNHYFVTPDNGTLTLVAKRLGIAEVREIDENVNRLPGSGASHTFHGRDIYSYTGARLAAGEIEFDKVGPLLANKVFSIEYESARIEGRTLVGGIPILDPSYGNVWTNIPMSQLLILADAEEYTELYGHWFSATISKAGKVVFTKKISFQRSFAGVARGEPLMYVNSLENLALALNQANFAKHFNVSSGGEWRIEITVK